MLRLVGSSLSRRNKGLVSTSLRVMSSQSHPSESFLNGATSVYAESMLAAWKKDPSSVHASWAAYFTNLEAGVPVDGGAFEPPSSLQSK